MELSSPELIQALKSVSSQRLRRLWIKHFREVNGGIVFGESEATEATASRVRKSRPSAAPPRPAEEQRRRPCRCGRCPECIENARWERIFKEKFADPTYYTRPAVRSGSPLRSL